MAKYDYFCETHGVFEATQPMSKYADPAPCPECGAMCEKIFLSVPNFSGLDASTRHAHATNEAAQHEPKTNKNSHHGHHHHVHGPGCGCGAVSKKKSKTQVHSNGAKSFKGSRPWMISH